MNQHHKCNTFRIKKFSYAHCPSVGPLEYVSINDLIKKNAETNPDQEIFIFRELNGSRQTLTYKELYDTAKRVALYLISINVKRQELIGLFGPNSLNRIIAEIGILLAGAVVLHLNIEVKDASDARGILDQSECRVVFVDPGESYVYETVIQSLNTTECTNKINPQNRKYIYLRPAGTSSLVLTLRDIVSNTIEDSLALPEVYPEDDAVIFSTSGSTGKSKMVVHGHFSYSCIPSSVSSNHTNPVVPGKDFNDRPFWWSGGNHLYPVIACIPRVFTDSPLGTKGMTISEIWRILKEENVTNAFLMPYYLYDMINDERTLDNDGFRLKSITTCGQVIDNFYTHVVGRFCDKLTVIYGSTEAGDIAGRQVLRAGDLPQAGDVGKPREGVEVRVVNEKQHPLLIGETGEIQVRSHYMMKGYHMDEQLTTSVFTADTPAWLRTGDVGLIKEDGNIVVQGRLKDNISRGGRKILPCDIDRMIKQITGVSHVMTIAVPDSRLYEEICVCYTTINGVNPTAETVKSYCEGLFIKNCTGDGLGIMPKYFLLFEEFPVLSTGKPNKQMIKKEAKHMLGLEC